MNYKDSLEVVGIIELVLNSLLICYLLYLAIKHNISKSNGGIDVQDPLWENDYNGYNVKISL